MTYEDDPSDPIAATAAKWSEHGWDGGAKLLASLSVLRVEAMIREGSSKLLRRYDLTYPRHELLSLLLFTKRGALPMGKIGRLLWLHPTSVTSTVSGLVKLGFVERVADPRDGRSTLARITPRGRKVVRETAPHLLEIEFGLSALTEAEAVELYRLLKKVRFPQPTEHRM